MKLANRSAFTMLELIIVILILAILIVLAYPQYIKLIEKAYAGEAIRTLGAIARDSAYYHDLVDDQYHDCMGVTTARWKYVTGPLGRRQPKKLYLAERTSGPFQGTYIGIFIDKATGEKSFAGTHPGTPK